jgi:hypothetical protein
MVSIRKSAVLVSAVAALGAASVLPASASAQVKPRVSPAAPIVDDAITVSWRTDRTLKPGYHYEIAVVTAPGTGCASFVVKKSKRHPKKGAPMSMRLSPYDDKLNGGPAWCQGKASIMITTAKDTGHGGSAIGIIEVRFRPSAYVDF